MSMRRCLRRASDSWGSTLACRHRRDSISSSSLGSASNVPGVDASSDGGSTGSDASDPRASSGAGGPHADAMPPPSALPQSHPPLSSSSAAGASSSMAPVARPKWSFITNPNDRDAINRVHHSNSVVPNNEAKPLLPMWSSSLTSPKLDKLRLSPDSWVNPFLSAGFHTDEDVELFVRWVIERSEAAERSEAHRYPSDEDSGRGGRGNDDGSGVPSFLTHALRHHIRLKPRAGGSCRGVFARRDFVKGDVIAAVPVAVGTSSTASTSSFLWGLMLNSDTLRHHSAHAQHRAVPSFAKVQELMAIRRSQFDPFPHELFVDQVYAALFLACEKEAGADSPLFPYLRLLPDPAVDDDVIKAQHHDIMEPNSWREYEDHRGSMRAFLFRILGEWTAQVEAANASVAGSTHGGGGGVGSTLSAPPPPTMKSLEWALRTVLARQVMIPSLRSSADVVERLRRVATETDRLNQEEFWMRNVTKARQFFLRHVLRVLDDERTIRANAFDPLTIATLVPVVDMIQHDALGGNVKIAVCEETPAVTDSANSGRASASEVLVVATQPIRAGQELRRCFSRCYSASYTLYRYGFLAVRDRVLDRECDMLAAGHSVEWIGASRTAEQLLDCDGEVRAIAAGPRSFSITSSSGGDAALGAPAAHVGNEAILSSPPSSGSSNAAAA